MAVQEEKEGNFFEEFGLKVTQGEVEVGNTYPIFGMITRFIDDIPGKVVAEINYNIEAKFNVPDSTKLELLKERAFESGIFVSKVVSKEPVVKVECKTVIFGKKQGYHA